MRVQRRVHEVSREKKEEGNHIIIISNKFNVL